MSDGHHEGISTAVSDAFAHANFMVTKWVLVAEVIDEDGERCVWADTAERQTAWDSLGLLNYATQMEQAAAVTRSEDEE